MESHGTAVGLLSGALAQFAPWLRFAQATAALGVLLAAAAFAFWLLKRLRGSEARDTLAVHDTLAKFREVHARGGLSDEEFRTIKTKLARPVSGEPAGDTGLDPERQESPQGEQLQEEPEA